ncbi:MAG: outer membrane lipoprotein-sorting protein [SAR324 cluster bacterium]|nr:outer membrane lipoprotein-sorting protein [SAR324 cluster bacterium]
MMNKWNILVLGACLAGIGTSAWALTADEIMQRVNDREDGDNIVMEMQMVLINKNNEQRVRRMQQYRQDKGEDSQSVIFFEEPADVRNTGFLTYDYDDESKDDDQWMYLPALRKTKRIAASDKSGSFMGSDFNYSDLTSYNLSDYNYKLLKENDEVDGSDAWVIYSEPKNDDVKEETGYAKSVIWVRKDNYVVVRAKNWVHKSPDIKFFQFKDLQQIEGVWFPSEIKAQRRFGKEVVHQTILRQQNIRLNQNLEDSLFSQRRLEQGL